MAGFGVCTRPVCETYQHWQCQLEAEPVEFLGRRRDGKLRAARQELAAYLHADADHLVFVPNATVGFNSIVRSRGRTARSPRQYRRGDAASRHDRATAPA